MIVGIDTSCYTTSLAIINESGQVFLDSRILLQVQPGEKGLRQSTAVFQHLQNLPKLIDQSFSGISVAAVAASVYPRPMPNSYLPVFKVGASFGETLSKLLGVPFIATSHQEGHIRAGFDSNYGFKDQDFLAWHISGGTTELLLVKPKKSGYSIEIAGGTSDLQVGQFVDRVGVALGLNFPAGPYLEKMALEARSYSQSLPVVTKGLTISFSGPATAALKLIDSGIDGPDLARGVFRCIGKSLLQVTTRAVNDYHINRVMLVGGVASNQIIRDYLVNEGSGLDVKYAFARKELSSDNAVGVGLIGYDSLN
jgi:N6-L-threonylcarbamoyladenine synthase